MRMILFFNCMLFHFGCQAQEFNSEVLISLSKLTAELRKGGENEIIILKSDYSLNHGKYVDLTLCERDKRIVLDKMINNPRINENINFPKSGISSMDDIILTSISNEHPIYYEVFYPFRIDEEVYVLIARVEQDERGFERRTTYVFLFNSNGELVNNCRNYFMDVMFENWK